MRILALDSQILNTVMACGMKTKYAFIDMKEPEKKAEALEKGDLMHRMLKHYYKGVKSGRKKDEFDLLVKEAIEIGRIASVDMALSDSTVEENIHQFFAYCNYYKQDGWDALEVETPFSKVLYENEERGIKILYEGIIDLVAMTPHGPAIVDHKTASRRQQPFLLSTQFMGYAWALNVDRVIVNKIGFQKTLPPKDRFNRFQLWYPKQLIAEWKREAIYYSNMLMSWIDQGYFPHNYTSCDKYSGCIYQQVCASTPEVRPHKLSMFYKDGQPWSPHTRDD
jgi:hypothetical protein